MTGHIFYDGFDEFLKDYEDAVLPEYLLNEDTLKQDFAEKIREDSITGINEYLEPCKTIDHVGRKFYFAVIRGNWEYPDTIILYEYAAYTGR